MSRFRDNGSKTGTCAFFQPVPTAVFLVVYIEVSHMVGPRVSSFLHWQIAYIENKSTRCH